MREELLSIIKGICSGKAARYVAPASALYSEISNALHKEVQDTLNEMVKDGTLEWNRTINSISFKLKDNGNNN